MKEEIEWMRAYNKLQDEHLELQREALGYINELKTIYLKLQQHGLYHIAKEIENEKNNNTGGS